ncbi:MAG: biotin/lipoyl-binding protein [Caldilineaceae bacterium]|nr:biotin/lipoyl-binding protein [Caldilineaceae bacterium]
MKRTTLVIIVVAVIAALGFAAFQFGLIGQPDEAQTASEAADPAEEPLPPQSADRSVIVDARVSPAEKADLSFPTNGRVAQILVDEGDDVTAGQVLIQLDASQQQTAVSRARADLQRAQANLSQLTAGARPEEIESAQAVVAASAARLDRVSTGSLPGEIASAQASLASSQASLDKVLEGPTEQELIEAKASLANAEASLRQAQSAYDEVKWRNDISALPQSSSLEQATNNFEAARARLDDLQSPPSAADLSRARADVDRARAQLGLLESTLPADVAAAQADLRQAQSQLDLLLAGARSEEIAIAEAEVAAATASLQQALVSLGDTELRAPLLAQSPRWISTRASRSASVCRSCNWPTLPRGRSAPRT